MTSTTTSQTSSPSSRSAKFSEQVWGALASIAHDRGMSIADVIWVGVKTALGAGTPPPQIVLVDSAQLVHVRQMIRNKFTDAEIAKWTGLPPVAVAVIREEEAS